MKTTVDYRTTILSLKRNGITAFFAKNGEEAKKKVLDLIPKGSEVLTVPSATLDAIGATKELQSTNYKLVRGEIFSKNKAREEKEIRKLRSAPEFVVGSAQAITQDGKILAVSTTGSQLSSYVYGSMRVILVVGINKIVENIEEGMKRVYEYALPLENKRSQKAYGTSSGVNKVLIINKEAIEGRITVILVEEKLGF